jgi:hypothetical protein
MSADRPSPADLAEAERKLRQHIGPSTSGDVAMRAELTVLMANYARLQRIEQAAANYVYTDAGDPAIADRYVELEAALNGDPS